jgi:hypothetical protein
MEGSGHVLVNRSAGVTNRYTFPRDDGRGWVMLLREVLENACWQAIGIYIATRKFQNRISGQCDPGLRTLAQVLHTSQAKILASIEELERINAYRVVRTDARVVAIKGGRAFRSSRNRYIFPKPTRDTTRAPAEAELEGTIKQASTTPTQDVNVPLTPIDPALDDIFDEPQNRSTTFSMDQKPNQRDQ